MNTLHKPTSGGLVGGVFLILLGLLFFVGNVFRVDVWNTLWPLFIIGFGAMFFVGMLLGGKSAGGLAIPGSMFVVLGLIFLAQSLFNNWASWSYTWALFAVTGVGIGLVIFSWWSDKPQLKRPGYTLILIGLILFFVFGAFFEAMFGLFGLSMAGSFVMPVALIGLGLLILFGRMIDWNRLLDQLPPHNSMKS